MEAFKGVRIQRGHGIGKVFKLISKVAWPLLKPLLAKGAKTVGKTVMGATRDIATDVLKGDTVKRAAKRRMKQGLDALYSQQRGRGIKRVCRRQKSSVTHRLRRKRIGKSHVKMRQNRKRRRGASMPPGLRALLQARKMKRRKKKSHKRRRKSHKSLSVRKRVVRRGRKRRTNPFH